MTPYARLTETFSIGNDALAAAMERLFGDKFFSRFYRLACLHNIPPVRIEPIPVSGRGYSDFRKRAVMLNDRKTLLQTATRYKAKRAGGSSLYLYDAYVLRTPSEPSDCNFYFLGQENFILAPRAALRPKTTTVLISENSKYYRFIDNFDAVA